MHSNKLHRLRLPAFTVLLVGALGLAGCAQNPFKPKPITQAQLKAAGATQSPAIQQAQQKVAKMKQAIEKSNQQYQRARRDDRLGQQRLSVAQQYANWQRLKLEKAQVEKELAHARVQEARAEVEAAEAQAVANSQSQQQAQGKGIDVSRYHVQVANQKESVASLEQQKANLETRISQAHRNYVEASNNLKAAQNAVARQNGENADSAAMQSQSQAPKQSQHSAQSSQQSGQGNSGGAANGTGSGGLQDIHPAGKVINSQPLEVQPYGNSSGTQSGDSGNQ